MANYGQLWANSGSSMANYDRLSVCGLWRTVTRLWLTFQPVAQFQRVYDPLWPTMANYGPMVVQQWPTMGQ